MIDYYQAKEIFKRQLIRYKNNQMNNTEKELFKRLMKEYSYWL